MKQPSTFLCRISVVLLVAFLSCSEEEAPVPLQANAGADLAATVATVVTLDGSASTGPEGFSYEWTYMGGTVSDENELTFTDVNSAKASFVPPKNGSYTFTLRIEHNGKFSEDQISVTVTGVLTLPSTISSAMVLQDIEPDPTKPDYIANGLVTISAGLSTTASAGSLNIQFGESAGLVVQSGNVDLTGVKMTSTSGWKGVLLTGGALTLYPGTVIEKAGKSAFDGQTETASIVMAGGTLKLYGTTFSGSQGAYDLLASAGTFAETVYGTTFSAAKPVKADIKYISFIGSGNTMPGNYDYILLTTPGSATVATSASGINGFQFYAYKYFVDGDFSAGSDVTITSSAKIFMKEGAGIFQSAGTLSSSGCMNCNPSTGPIIDGLNAAPWKGIAVGNAQLNLSNIEIKNAGSAVFSTGSFMSSSKAAIYYTATNYNGTISDSKITDSKGYGVYVDSPPGLYVRVSNSTIANPTNPGISVFANEVYRTIASTGNTFTMPANTAAVEVRTPNPSNNVPIGTWQPLGGTNYYQFTNHVIHNTGSWIVSAGTILKFKAGKSLRLEGSITAIGTTEQPIVFDSEAGTAGTWGGITVESLYKFEYCQIKNGGELNIFNGVNSPSSEKANLVFNYGGTSTANTFKNNTISGSAGYGILVEALKQNPQAENVANANTFSNNVSGNVIVK